MRFISHIIIMIKELTCVSSDAIKLTLIFSDTKIDNYIWNRTGEAGENPALFRNCMGSSLMANPSRGHEKRGTQSECLPVSTAGNLARSKSGTWVDSSKPCLQKVWKAQRLTKKWKECTASKEHCLGEAAQQSLFARSDLWFSWKSKSYRMNSRRYRACFCAMKWVHSTACFSAAFLYRSERRWWGESTVSSGKRGTYDE